MILQLPHSRNFSTNFKRPNSYPNQHHWLIELQAAFIPKLNKKDFQISDLAFDLFLSPRQLFRKVKAATGKTPNLYLRELRLQKAKQLLLSGECETVKEVAIQVGYLRVDYFSKLFEQAYGERPTILLNRANLSFQNFS